MPDTPLNPDALEAACLAAIQNESPGATFADEEDRRDWLGWMRPVVSAYLAVAQPEVNSVEELESYPLGTVFLDDLDDVMQHLTDGEGGSYWVRTGDFRYYDVTEVELPARVLYRPVVNDA